MGSIAGLSFLDNLKNKVNSAVSKFAQGVSTLEQKGAASLKQAGNALRNSAQKLYQSAEGELTNVKKYVAGKNTSSGQGKTQKAAKSAAPASKDNGTTLAQNIRKNLQEGQHQFSNNTQSSITGSTAKPKDKENSTAQSTKGDKDNILGNAKYVNPAYYQGKVQEYTGKGIKFVGEKMNGGVEGIDNLVKNSNNPLVNNPITEQALGRTSAALGFVGDLAEGTGSLLDWSGRLVQGDTKTIEDTKNTAKSIFEGFSCVEGKLDVVKGDLLVKAGEALHSESLTELGEGSRESGEIKQRYASPETKAVVDTVGEASVNYLSRISEKEGQALKWVGDKTGNDMLSKAGESLSKDSEMAQESTSSNPLVQEMDRAYDEKKKGYIEHPNYNVTKDVTRLALEIGTLFVGGEAIVGKTGTGANLVTKGVKTAEGVDKTVEGLKVADKTAEMAEVVDKTVDATKGAEKVAEVTATTEKAESGLKAVDTTGNVVKDANNGVKGAEATTGVSKTAGTGSANGHRLDPNKYRYFFGEVEKPCAELKATDPKKYDQLMHNYNRSQQMKQVL